MGSHLAGNTDFTVTQAGRSNRPVLNLGSSQGGGQLVHITILAVDVAVGVVHAALASTGLMPRVQVASACRNSRLIKPFLTIAAKRLVHNITRPTRGDKSAP